MLADFLGLANWQVGLIGALIVLIVVLLVVRNKQNQG